MSALKELYRQLQGAWIWMVAALVTAALILHAAYLYILYPGTWIHPVTWWMEIGAEAQGAWLQAFGGTVAVAVAIAIPLVLHVRDRNDRLQEREALARTHTLAVRPSFLELLSDLYQLEREINATGDGIALEPEIDKTIVLADGIKHIYKKYAWLLARSQDFHLLGDSATTIQTFVADMQALNQTAELAEYGLVYEEELQARLTHAKEMLKAAVTAMHRLFGGGYKP